jgi:hypothetical protein
MFMLEQLIIDENYIQKFIFSDEGILHTYSVINCHNCRIWCSENLHALMEHVRHSPKLNMWCGIMSDQIVGPFFFRESIVTSAVYMDMLENFMFLP